jgi:hypothetical protein
MDKLKECLNHLKNTISSEIHGVSKLEGDGKAKMCEDFCLDEDIRVYFNEYNLFFIAENDYAQMSPYLKSKDKVLELDIPGHNIYLSIYQYFNNNLLETYLNK